jgi:hypothetical protein
MLTNVCSSVFEYITLKFICFSAAIIYYVCAIIKKLSQAYKYSIKESDSLFSLYCIGSL